MTAPVDVLAVMDCVIAGEREWGAHEAANALTNARAAVVDLIDECTELSLTPHGHVDSILHARIAAVVAALARVGGAA
ncbi:hypothetical protein [Xanthomonas citri]|uniref:hypothetical protein n=1 Tax=Xanthomonas citri TaxID=346 RepID=UPI0004A822E8|nr:hypothetical protein [Xanthomonas citri]QTK37299.1 hypothetical protein XcgCFBP7119R_12845 [Xanthomonas citri pv. glycines]